MMYFRHLAVLVVLLVSVVANGRVEAGDHVVEHW